MSQLEAAELLGMSERTFRRYVDRFEEEGDEGLVDRRLGRRSGRAVPEAEAEEVERLYRERYQGFTAKHFHEHLQRNHSFRWGYTWTKTFLQERGLLAKAPRRGAHRRKRPRRPMIGMMLHQDGSRHVWLEGLGPLDLVVTLDDATSEIYSAILVEEEGTMSSFLGLAETIAAKGLFCSLYTDRGSHYFHTPEAGGKVARDALTQVGRALAQLGIEHIPAYSPEARGRSERMFRTLQDRLPKELKLAGIADIGGRQPVPEGDLYRQRTTPALRWRRPRPARPSCRRRKSSGAMSSPSRRSARSRLTTRWPGTAGDCRSRPIPDGLTTCAPRCAFTNIPTANSPSSMARAAWSDGGAKTSKPATDTLPRKRQPLAPPPEACGNRGKAEKAFPPFPQAQQQQQKAVNSCAT